MRRVIFTCTVLLLTVPGLPASAQAGDEWSGTVFYEDRRTDEIDSAVSITRLPDGTFSVVATVQYTTNPGHCGEAFFRKFEGVGELTQFNEAIEFEGTLSHTTSSTCGERTEASNGPARYVVQVEGGTISGYIGVGLVDLVGPLVVEGTDGSDDLASEEAAASADGEELPGETVGTTDAAENVAGAEGDEQPASNGAKDGKGIDRLVLPGAGGVAVVGVGGALEMRRRRRKGLPRDTAQAESPEQEEREPSTVSLELTYPAGHSPFVFQFGWVFGARCLVVGSSGQRDLSDRVRWSGSDSFEFYPAVGRISHPRFIRGTREMSQGEKAHGTITLSVDVDGETLEKTFTVGIVSIRGYARVNDQAFCPDDSHGGPSCPHPTVGPITSGSSTVTIDGVPAARVGDTGVHSSCCGSNTYTIAGGDPSVLIDGRPAAMIGSKTQHCAGVGSITTAYAAG